MKHWIALSVVLSVVIHFMIPTSGSAGSNMEGTYTSTLGNVVLDLKPGGKAVFTLIGESMPCTYKVKGREAVVGLHTSGGKGRFCHSW